MSLPLPQEFTERMQRLLGTEYEEFLASYQLPRVGGLRVNPQKIATEEFAERTGFSLTPVPWAREGFIYGENDRPGKHPWHDAGLYYMQEPSAMAVAALADPKPGEKVLDLCAAPGGKTTHLAGRMQNQGILFANEIHKSRANILAQNVERMGTHNVIVTYETPARLAERFPNYFDCIVVDAPCSGEGMFRKDDVAISEWKPELPQMCAERQLDILEEAVKMLRAGGRMVYSTCTFAPEENEGTISRLLDRHPELEVIKTEAPWFSHGHPEWVENGNPAVADTFRLFPHKLSGEGHYAALLRKNDGEESETYMNFANNAGRIAFAEWNTFVEETLNGLPEGRVVRVRNSLCLMPECCPDLTGIHVKQYGVPLCTIKRTRVDPVHGSSHGLYIENFQRVIDAPWDSELITKYLHGEVLPADGMEKGWCAVAADGFVIGWGKVADGVVKNHYPKGLRWVGR